MQNAIKFFFFILFLNIYQVVFSQNVTAISPDKLNVLYIGIDNPFTIAMEKVPADKLNVTISEGGTIKKIANGSYIVNVNRPGKLTIYVEGQGVKQQKEFRVRPIPEPTTVINIHNSKGGILTIGEIKGATGLMALINGFDMDTNCVIHNYKIVIKHLNGETELYSNKGGLFGKNLLKAFNTAKTGDTITFSEVYTYCPSFEEPRNLQGISFVIK
jgi:GldM C-terminal domain